MDDLPSYRPSPSSFGSLLPWACSKEAGSEVGVAMAASPSYARSMVVSDVWAQYLADNRTKVVRRNSAPSVSLSCQELQQPPSYVELVILEYQCPVS